MIRWSIILAILASLLIVSCDMGKKSDPVSMSDIIGIYIPNHNGTETLQIREDHVWIRSYTDNNNKRFIDSGNWQLGDLESSGQRILIDGIFNRHKKWISSIYWDHREIEPDDSARLVDSIPYPSLWGASVRRDNKRIRLMVPQFYPSRFYVKLLMDQ